MRGAGAAARSLVSNPTQFYVGPQATRALLGRPFNPYAAGLEASLALMPGAGAARFAASSRYAIKPALASARAARIGEHMAAYVPRANNMRERR